MVSQPLISVVIPFYNAQSWLAETLNSVLSQSWRNVEVILVNDGSTDESVEIATGYLSKSVCLLHQDNRGACAARNFGLRTAQGEFVQFLDADDLLHPQK